MEVLKAAERAPLVGQESAPITLDTGDSALVASRLLELLPRILGEIRREVALDTGCLTLAQFRILCQLEEDPSSNNKSLAGNTGVSVAAASRMVDGLVERGLVERNRDPKDKRQCDLRLTDSGVQVCEEFRRMAQRALQRHLKSVSPLQANSINESLELLTSLFARKHNAAK